MLAAGDTFRAAAVEQLQIWGERAGCPVLTRPTGSDAAGLAYDALEQGARRGRRHPADRHRRAAAQQGRPDGRIAEDRPRAEKGRPGGAACGAAGARRDGRPERARPGRDLPRDGRRHRHRHDQARRHRARAACWSRWPRNTASRSTRSASAKPPRICARSRRAPTPAAWSAWTPDTASGYRRSTYIRCGPPDVPMRNTFKVSICSIRSLSFLKP